MVPIAYAPPSPRSPGDAGFAAGASRRQGLLLDAAVIGWYLVLTTVSLWPIIIGLDSVVPHSVRDPGFQATVLHDVSERLLHLDLAHLFDASFFYPAHLTLAMADAQLGLQPIALPLHLLFGDALLVLNILVVASFPVTALSGDLLGRYLTHSRVGGFMVGTAYAFTAYRFEHVIHLQLLQSWTLALAYLGLEMSIRERRRRGPLLWAFAVVAAAFTSLNYLLLLVITQPIYLVTRIAFATDRRALLVRLRGLIVLGVVTAGLIGIAVIPYVALRLQGYERTLAATFPFSARAIDYLVPAADSVALHPLFALHPPRTGIDERELFPGGVIIAAALLGGIAAIVMRRTAHLLQIAPWVAAGGFAFLFSFGPYLWPDTAAAPSNTGTLISLPYRYLARPLLLESLRSPARFGVIVLLAVAVIAAFAVVRVLTRLKRPWLRMMVVAALGLGMAVEYSVSIPVEQVAWGSRLPPVYAWLRQQAPGPVVELPGAGVEVSYYLLASTVDGHPRINGWSGFTPRDHVAIGRPVTAASLPGWLAVARTLGAEYLVVHADGLDPGTLAALRLELDRGSLMSVARFGSDEVFRFGKPTASRPGSGSAVGETPTSLRGPARGGS